MLLPDLKIGTIFAIFNLSGIVHVMKDWFIIWARGVEISLIVFRIILVDMLLNHLLLFSLMHCVRYDGCIPLYSVSCYI